MCIAGLDFSTRRLARNDERRETRTRIEGKSAIVSIVQLIIMSLNIEGDKHLPEVTRFIQNTKPDVVCLQEVFETDYKRLTVDLKLQGKFLPTVYIDVPGKPGFHKRGVFGVAILSRVPGTFGEAYYMKRRQGELPLYHGRPNAGHRVLLWENIDNHLTVATTHFTWSKGGRATNRQRKELNALMKLVNTIQPDILCGDFNAPRGKEIWTKLSKQLVDNIPPQVTSTIDPRLHYTKGLNIVVDGFFTSHESRVRVTSLKLVSGVSDHQAIVATITH